MPKTVEFLILENVYYVYLQLSNVKKLKHLKNRPFLYWFFDAKKYNQ